MILFLNSIGTGEIVIILLFILIFFGAESIPGFARTFGRGIRQIKNASQDVQDEIMRTTNDIRREMNTNRALEDVKKSIEKPLGDFKENLESTGHSINNAMKEKIEIAERKSNPSMDDGAPTTKEGGDDIVIPDRPLDQLDL